MAPKYKSLFVPTQYSGGVNIHTTVFFVQSIFAGQHIHRTGL